jgi:hypothetical protein
MILFIDPKAPRQVVTARIFFDQSIYRGGSIKLNRKSKNKPIGVEAGGDLLIFIFSIRIKDMLVSY